jgi:TnpA family transposase
MHFSHGKVSVYLKYTSTGTSMPRRELLTAAQREVLTEPTTDERTMVRYYTLGAEDRSLIDRRRGEANRLWVAIMLCYCRFPGRPLLEGERPPREMLAFVAAQLSLDPACFSDYAGRDQTRRKHLAEIVVFCISPRKPAFHGETHFQGFW